MNLFEFWMNLYKAEINFTWTSVGFQNNINLMLELRDPD
jgi:hypothetical protein